MKKFTLNTVISVDGPKKPKNKPKNAPKSPKKAKKAPWVLRSPKMPPKPKCSTCEVIPKKYRKEAGCKQSVAGIYGQCAAMHPKDMVDAYLEMCATEELCGKIGIDKNVEN